jgi:hypothetical protein
MRHRQRSILYLLLLSAAFLTGCNTTRARSAPARSSIVKSQTAPLPLSRHPSRDSAFALYHNPAYGVSFRYPRNYALDSLDEDEDADAVAESPALKTQQQLDAEQPGALLLATIEIPADAYPNTTFVEGHLQFAVNPQSTAESCRALVAPPDSDWPGATDQTIIQGIPFHWRDRGVITPDVIVARRDYAGFSAGACYEFFLEVAATPPANQAPASAAASDASAAASSLNSPTHLAPADLPKILRPLEKTVSSFQFHPVL